MSEGTQDELERQRARWWATVSSGDLDGYLALFAEDAVWVTPELDEIVGREAIRAWLEPVFAQFDYELTITVADVRVAGSLGIERARFVSRMTPKPPSVRRLPVTPAPPPGLAPEPEPLTVEGEEGQAAPAPGTEEGAPWDVDEADVAATPEVAPDPAADESTGDQDHHDDHDDHDDHAEANDGEVASAPDDLDTDAEANAAEVANAPDDLDTDAGPNDAEAADAAAGLSADADDLGAEFAGADADADADTDAVEAPLVPGGPDAAEDEPHEGRYLMYWRWHDDAGWLVHRYADVTGVG